MRLVTGRFYERSQLEKEPKADPGQLLPHLQCDLCTFSEGPLNARDPEAIDDVLGEAEGDHLGDLEGDGRWHLV